MNVYVIFTLLISFITLVYTKKNGFLNNDDDLNSLKRYTREIRQENCMLHLCNETNYPLKEINKLMKKKSNLKFFETFGDQIFEPYQPPERVRIRPLENLCQIRQVTMYPRIGRNINDDMKVIVNIEKHRQGIVVETCIEERVPCIENDFLPVGIKTKCIQQYVKIRLVTLASTGSLNQDYFAIPSGCVCKKQSPF